LAAAPAAAAAASTENPACRHLVPRHSAIVDDQRLEHCGMDNFAASRTAAAAYGLAAPYTDCVETETVALAVAADGAGNFVAEASADIVFGSQ